MEPVIQARAVDDHGRLAGGELVRELFDVAERETGGLRHRFERIWRQLLLHQLEHGSHFAVGIVQVRGRRR